MSRDVGNKSPLITIIGAGVGGLTLAAALLRLGSRVRVLEQASRFTRIGTGIGLAPNATKVLRGLGLIPALEKLAYHPAYRASREWDTAREMARYPVKGEMEARYGGPYFLLHRGDLHQALYELMPPGVVEFGRQLVGVRNSDDTVVLSFAGGREETADVVVGADGVHSRVRESLFGVGDPRFTGRVAYRSVFPASLLAEPLLDPNTKWWGPDRHIVIYYVSGGREVYFTTSAPHEAWVEESFSTVGDLAELRAAFEGFHPAVRGVLEACPQVQKWAIYERDPLATWRAGRVALLGDACHPMTPYMQQGAATAIEDGVVLARCLRGVGPGGVEEAFDRYESARKERTSVIQAESSRNTWNATSEGSPAVSHEFVYAYDAWRAPLGPGRRTSR